MSAIRELDQFSTPGLVGELKRRIRDERDAQAARALKITLPKKGIRRAPKT